MNSARELAAVWRARWVLLAVAALAMVVATWLSARQDPEYESRSVVKIVLGQQSAGAFTSSEERLNVTNLYTQYARLRSVREAAVRGAGVPGDPAELRADLSAQPREQPLGIILEAHAASPDGAARLANAYAGAFNDYVFDVQSARRARTLGGLAERRRQLVARRPKARADEATVIQQNLIELDRETQDELRTPLDQTVVVQPGTRPLFKAWPKPKRDGPLGAIFALVIATALVVLRSRRRFTSPEEAAEQLDLPLLGAVPEAGENDPRTAEAMRTVRTRLEVLEGEYHAVVLLASAEPRAGRTQITADLARAIAGGGMRVAAVDGDLRSPSLHEELNVGLEPGLTDDATDGIPVQASPDFHSRDDRGALDVVTAGRRRVPAPALLGSQGFADTMDVLKSRYDYVLVDSPPLGGVSDAVLLSEVSSMVVLVVNARRTVPRRARRAIEVLSAAGHRPIGLIYNFASDDQVLQGAGRLGRSRAISGYRA